MSTSAITKFSKWFVAVEDNTIDSMRSCLSRINMIESGLNIDLQSQTVKSLKGLNTKITNKNFSVAEGTLKNYKSAINTFTKYREFKALNV